MAFQSFIPYLKARRGPRAELGKRPPEAEMRRRWARDSAACNAILQMRLRVSEAQLKKQED